MKFPICMLRDYVETRLSAEEVGDLLTMAGFELEGIEEVEGESVLDIKVVSNRGDGLSVFGLSREVLAKDPHASATDLYRNAVSGFPIGDEEADDCSLRTSVTIESQACTRYACRMLEGVSNGDSPVWLQRRLRQAGQRPLGILVDLTNYVMLELGQPLHAFDFDNLAGNRIVVRCAKPGEKLTTLNGVEHTLKEHNLLICDSEKAVAIAGVMGGAESEVSETTHRVLLESAHFVNTSVRKTRKEVGLSTDASYRFERSVDPNGVVRGLNRFAQLLKESGSSATIVPGVLDQFPLKPDSGVVSIRVSKTSELLGMEVTTEEVRSYLERLGFAVSGGGEPFDVELPSWRPDIVDEMDLIEEVGRVHGYEKIPKLAPIGSTPMGGLQGNERIRDQVRATLLQLGFTQAISHSLRDTHPLDSPNWESIGPNVPGSPEMAWLRSSLWPCLADAALRNGGRDCHFFEIGRIHGKFEGTFREGQRIAILSVGRIGSEHWNNVDKSTADFYSMKGVMEKVAAALGIQCTLSQENPDSRLHPTRQASVQSNGTVVGVFGQIHPSKATEIGLPAETVLAAIDFDLAAAHSTSQVHLRSISRNPAVRRDISVLLPTSIPYSQVETVARDAAGVQLERFWLSDVYTGSSIAAGMHSLTLSLQFRKMGENYTDEEANQLRDVVVSALESLGAKQR